METIEAQDLAALSEDEQAAFGKPPLAWQLRNNWTKPKRKRKSTKIEIDLWHKED